MYVYLYNFKQYSYSYNNTIYTLFYNKNLDGVYCSKRILMPWIIQGFSQEWIRNESLRFDNTPPDERLSVQHLTLLPIANKTLVDGFQEIYVNWTQPIGFPGVRVYIIVWKHVSTGQMGNNTSNATDYRISGLRACSLYNVSVRASNGNETSDEASSSTSTYSNCKYSYQTKFEYRV